MRQVAALPYRFVDGSGGPIEVLLITSFRSRRWIIPKGNVDFGMSPHQAAAQEALEEAGVVGEIGNEPLGTFSYTKLVADGTSVEAEVEVYPLPVSAELDDWPERNQRERRWLPISEAIEAVVEPDLAAIMASFRP
jgi:uncharacterized protein